MLRKVLAFPLHVLAVASAIAVILLTFVAVVFEKAAEGIDP